MQMVHVNRKGCQLPNRRIKGRLLHVPSCGSTHARLWLHRIA